MHLHFQGILEALESLNLVVVLWEERYLAHNSYIVLQAQTDFLMETHLSQLTLVLAT